jgi:hypothetical protein
MLTCAFYEADSKVTSARHLGSLDRKTMAHQRHLHPLKVLGESCETVQVLDGNWHRWLTIDHSV